MKKRSVLLRNIKKARIAAGLSQKKLAKKLNVSDKTISAYETGRAVPTVLALAKISEITSVSVSDILGLGKKMEREKKHKNRLIPVLVDQFSRFSALKKIERAGWVLKGIKEVETIADHNYRVGIMAMLICDTVPELTSRLDRIKIYELTLVHDWGVTSLGDIISEHGTTSVADKKSGKENEREIVTEISENFGVQGKRYVSLWDEYNEQKTPEARFLKQVEKLEMVLQALEYERQGYSSSLFDEFWENAEKYLVGKELEPIFRELQNLRNYSGS